MKPVSIGAPRKQLRPLVVLLMASALSTTGFISPSQAADVVGSTELIDSLVVKYESGASVLDSSGDPNGADSVSADVNLKIGENLGRGYRTINFDQPLPVSEAKAVAAELAGSSAVQTASPNYAFTINDDSSPVTVQSVSQITQNLTGNYNWGLDRIDQTTPALDGKFTYSSSGSRVKVYIVDSGVRATHNEFKDTIGQTRVLTDQENTFSAFSNDLATNDCNGHGTHVAGIAAGKTYGVAKTATIVPVKVLSCLGVGDTSTLIAGINWIISNHVDTDGTAVANFSLGPSSPTYTLNSVNAAIAALIADGVQPVVASGNGMTVNGVSGVAQDACNFSPANSPGTITVSASMQNDTKTSFSNYGTCVDIFAPGYDIASAGSLNNSDVAYKSGTSMAAPFVTGVIASLIQETRYISTSQLGAMLFAETVSVVPADAYSTTTRLLHQPTDGWTTSTKASTALQILAEQQAAAAIVEAARVESARVAAEQKAIADAAAAEAARVAAELASRTVKVNKKGFAAKTLATQTGISFTKKATVTFTISKVSKKICTKSGSKLRTLKTGQCLVTFTVQEPKPKKGKRPKAVKTSKVFIVQ